MDLALTDHIRQIRGMRWSPVLVAVLALGAATVHAGPASNPAFLGIEMDDAMTYFHRPGVFVAKVLPGGGAEAAGIRADDIITAIDGVGVADRQQLAARIVGHPPGESIKLEIDRGDRHLTISATLTSRAEILHRRFVGHALDPFEVTDLDDGHAFDLGELRGQTTVIGWFDARRCTGCTALFGKVADAAAAAKQPIKLVGVTYAPLADFDPQRRKMALDALASTRTALGVPLVVADEDVFRRAAIVEPDRVHFMVVDGRGIVRFVTPVAPDGDDLDAAIDEVLAAAEQADHSRAKR